MQSDAWQLTLTGPPVLRDPSGAPQRCSGKSLAILAFLALDGPTARSELAGLLWPDTQESTARNNLVHQLRRMQAAYGADLVQAGDVLSLSAQLRVDLTDQGELLGGVDWPELPELHDWLLARRSRLDAERAARWREQAQRQEDAGDWTAALDTVAQLRALDPLSEDALRREMRLHYLLGHAARALEVFETGRAQLQATLNQAPLPETQALARDITRGTLSAAQASPAPGADLPSGMARPPLVGREAEWAQMQDAWNAGQGVVLLGEAGVGKTRLALDFLDAHGGGMRFQGCLGDAGLPYATHARTYRQVLSAFPDLPLPDWVRAELTRIMPSLGGAPEPITDEARKVRFWQAKAEALGLAIREAGLRHLVFDDVQFMDDASIEAGAFVFAQLGWGQPSAPYRTIHCARPAQLGAQQQAVMQAMVDSGLIRIIPLGPLPGEAVQALVGALDLPDATGTLASELGRYTGGNPLLLLETARSLHAAPSLPGPLPLPESAGRVTETRLARLSPAALHAARAAAVLRSDFDVDLVAQVLGAPLLATLDAWEELQAAQVMRGAAFEHDLVADAVLAATPGAVRRLLHRAAARTLTRHGAPPARIARHWQAGGAAREAAPQFEQAAQHARAAYRHAEADEYTREAEHAYAQAG
ncbi:AAA family ATPase [Deinococcus radiotolerans]|uniref:Bacterial transcriptional activator domain-containing protein n=1 Tax=Deinococcus radiotolerans TaxID=1309407 RepID=A0ABQ2FK65_9DEIO|nr:AAA family ATPase [Deinococcus radiotolerans]GGK95727.1 hypothetical protein GCM10010844_12770 [Deinococcus radiotolerans]